MRSAGTTLQTQLGTFSAGVAATQWTGPDAELFRSDWKTSHSRVLREAVAFVNSAAAELSNNANEQDAASLAVGGPVFPPSSAVVYVWNPGPLDLQGKSKSKVMSTEQEIVALLPEDAVVSTWANDTSSLLRCEGERKKWAGDAVAELKPGVDRGGFLDEVAASMTGRAGWKVSHDKTSDRERSLDLLHEDGTHVLVS